MKMLGNRMCCNIRYSTGLQCPCILLHIPLSPTAVHVIIVGAGVAGLAAAGELLRGGAKVTILEASDHVGGRVHTCRLPALSPEELAAKCWSNRSYCEAAAASFFNGNAAVAAAQPAAAAKPSSQKPVQQ